MAGAAVLLGTMPLAAQQPNAATSASPTAASTTEADPAALRRQLIGRASVTTRVIDQMDRESTSVAPGGQPGDPAPGAQTAVAKESNTPLEGVRKELGLESNSVRQLEAEIRRRAAAPGEHATEWTRLQRDALLALGRL